MATYAVNPAAVAHARSLIDARQYVLDSDWARSSPTPRRRTPTARSTRGRSAARGISG